MAGISFTLTESPNERWPSTLESPNGSVNGLAALGEAHNATSQTSWREIVIFGLKLIAEDGEGNMNDSKVSAKIINIDIFNEYFKQYSSGIFITAIIAVQLEKQNNGTFFLRGTNYQRKLYLLLFL